MEIQHFYCSALPMKFQHRDFETMHTLQDENIHGIEFRDLAQIGHIQRFEYQQILTLEFQLHKLSLRDF